MTFTALPAWVWDLVDALDRSGDVYQLIDHVPDEIRATIGVLRERERRAMAAAWDQGYSACVDQLERQSKDSTHALRRENPYEDIPF